MIKTRFAPSPTGHLHIGGLRTAIFNYLYAKKNSGHFILRIEDTDKERSKEKYASAILEALKWCGLLWDKIYYQSQRTVIYEQYMEKLLKEGKAYRCYCSKERLLSLKKEQIEKGENPRYDGYCRDLNLNIPDKPHVVRIKLPKEDISYYDHVHGQITYSWRNFEDFIVRRSDGTFMYNFANVVDDIEMGITHVIRGDDHMTNTAKQLVLYKLLRENPPEYAHIPMILGEDKTRLSKRHGAKSVLEYRDEGFLADALVNYLARLGWSHGNQEIFTREELERYFDIGHLNKASAVFNPEKLLWVNEQHMKNTNPERLVELALPFMDESCKTKNKEYLKKAITTLVPRVSTLKELGEKSTFYCKAPTSYEEKGVKKYVKDRIKEPLRYLREKLKDASFTDEEELKGIFTETMERFGVKMIAIAQPVRIAITGKSVGPGIYESLVVLGKKESLRRINRFIEALGI